VPEPAFEIFRVDSEVAGGRVCAVMPNPDFAFALDDVLAAISPRTRVVFLTNPNNPTGVSMPSEAIRTIARRVPREAVVFVDEAYAEFAGASFIPELGAFPNVIVGRTFSKAFGLAGLRIGCLVGAGKIVDPVRAAIPVYSVNIAAVAAVQAALSDTDYLQDYLRQTKESKALLYAACDRLGLKYWKSDANFVLICAGDRLDALVKGAADRGIYTRDRSSEPGCAGCLRVATGIVQHTRRYIAVMEEVLCAAP
jgi:histidinol-phosphate aminotransferase